MPTRQEMHNLGQGIISSFEARTAGITSLQEEVKEQRQAAQAQLGELDRTHQAMARQMRGELAQGRSELRAMVNAQLHGLDQEHTALTKAEARRKGEVNTWLKEVDGIHQAMARHLRAHLARGRAALTAPEARRKAVVHQWIGQVATEHDGARQEWQRLGATMRGKRTGAPVRIGPVHEKEEPVARAVVGEATEELRALSDVIFQHLANHPDGTRLNVIEREFGLGRQRAERVARAMQHLMDEGKADKRGNLYFAT